MNDSDATAPKKKRFKHSTKCERLLREADFAKSDKPAICFPCVLDLSEINDSTRIDHYASHDDTISGHQIRGVNRNIDNATAVVSHIALALLEPNIISGPTRIPPEVDKAIRATLSLTDSQFKHIRGRNWVGMCPDNTNARPPQIGRKMFSRPKKGTARRCKSR